MSAIALVIGLSVAVPISAQLPEQGTISTQPLRPGDVIRLEIWREDDMSGDFTIDEAGRVVFPRVGEYSVTDDTGATLKARLLADYQQYLRNPSINITVLRRISITGAVNDPGLKLVDATITIADALALAGGPTQIGDPDKISIIRNGLTVGVTIRQDTRIGDTSIRSGDQIYVPERGWVSRNSNVVAAALSATAALIIALFVRR